MKLHKSITKFLIPAIILCAAFLQNCMDVPRDNDADRDGDKYNDIYSDKRITAFSFVDPAVTGVINETDSTITVCVLYGTDVTVLAAEFTTNAESVIANGREQKSGITVNDFSGPLYYDVTARDGSQMEYTVSTEYVAISRFYVTDPDWDEDVDGIINHDSKTITVGIPYYMDITCLVPGFDASDNVTQISGDENDFTDSANNPFIFKVTDPNGVSQEYAVTVKYNISVAHLAGSLGGPGSADGIGVNASFRKPQKITCAYNYLYVADYDSCLIRKIDKITGAVTTMAGAVYDHSGSGLNVDGTGTTARFHEPDGIATDGVNLYVSDTGNHTIRKIVITTAEVTTIAGIAGFAGYVEDANGYTGGITSRFNYPRGLAIEGTYLYVSDSNNHVVRRIDLSTGMVSTYAGSGAQGNVNNTLLASTFYSPSDITYDGTYFYVLDGSSSANRIRRLDSTNITTVATGFNQPSGITTDGINLYVADTANRVIKRISIASSTVTTIAGTTLIQGSNDGLGVNATFNNPSGITTDGTDLYVADADNHLIRKISQATRMVSTFAGTANYPGNTDGAGTAARFSEPMGIAVFNGNVYVADTDNNIIRKIWLASGSVITVAGDGTVGSSDDPGQVWQPRGITPGPASGNALYLADTENSMIRKIEMNANGTLGALSTIVGTGTFMRPMGITFDGSSYLYVADTGNNAIRRVAISSPYTVTAVVTAGLNYPTGIACDGVNVYVSNTNNNTILKIVIGTWETTLFAGDGTASYKDSTGAEAQFNKPAGLAIDCKGLNLYVDDMRNHVIRKIHISTQEVSTVAGTAGISGWTDGSESAFINLIPFTTGGISGVAFNDADKKLYVADTGNNCIRVITP